MMIEIDVPHFDVLDFPKFKNDFWLRISSLFIPSLLATTIHV